MNIEILKKNILEVIEQPYKWKYSEDIKPNGKGERKYIGLYIMLKYEPSDISREYTLTEGFVEKYLADMPEKYRGHLVTIKHDGCLPYSYLPVFDDTDTQALWDKEFEDFFERKAAFCNKYGSD